MTRRFSPLAADDLPATVARALDGAERPGLALRVAVDGPDCARPRELAAALVDPLRLLGRDVELIDAETFWRDASVRLEYGHQDASSLPLWLDADALKREVLTPLGPGGSGRFLPTLRDPLTNRSTRTARRQATATTVVIVSGGMLLGRSLPFDVTIHLSVSPPARRRRTPSEMDWTLAAWDAYDASTAPLRFADIVLRLDDPRRPAIG